jgi:hypothetical protein
MKILYPLLLILILFRTLNCVATFAKLGEYQSGNKVISVDIEGSFAFTARNDGLIEIIDVSDPMSPQLTGSYQLTENIPWLKGRIVVSDTLAFIICRANIHILNISNKYAPVYVTAWNYIGAQDIEISGTIAYIGNYNYLRVVDISDIYAPVLLYSNYGEIDGVCLNGSILYCVHPSSPGNLRIFDVSHPDSTILLSDDLDLPVYSNSDIGYFDGHVYIVCSNYFLTVDVSDPVNPVKVDTLRVKNTSNKIIVQGSVAYINNMESGFNAIDLSDPAIPSLLQFYDTRQNCNQVIVENDIAYLANDYAGLQIIDIAEPVNPWQLSSLSASSHARGMACKGDFPYLNDGNGLDLVNITDVNQPVRIGYYFDGYGISDDISILGDHLCFSLGYNWPELNFVDVSDPANPLLLHSIDLYGGYAYYYGLIPLDLTENNVFVGVDTTMRIYDISDFGNPDQVGVYHTGIEITDVLTYDNVCYIATGGNGFEVVNIQDVTIPKYVRTINTSGECREMISDENYLFVADGTGGIKIFNISNPNDPVITDSVKPHLTTSVVANPLIIGHHLVFADDSWNELFTYDITNIENPVFVSSMRINAETYRMAYYHDVIFCSADQYGMLVIDAPYVVSVDDPDKKVDIMDYMGIFPNPFTSALSINYELESADIVTIELFDIQGRKVSTLLKAYQDGGMHHINLNGKNNDTEEIPPGMFLIRINYNGRIETRKIIHLD